MAYNLWWVGCFCVCTYMHMYQVSLLFWTVLLTIMPYINDEPLRCLHVCIVVWDNLRRVHIPMWAPQTANRQEQHFMGHVAKWDG